jgi:hypothetical protein
MQAILYLLAGHRFFIFWRGAAANKIKNALYHQAPIKKVSVNEALFAAKTSDPSHPQPPQAYLVLVTWY